MNKLSKIFIFLMLIAAIGTAIAAQTSSVNFSSDSFDYTMYDISGKSRSQTNTSTTTASKPDISTQPYSSNNWFTSQTPQNSPYLSNAGNIQNAGLMNSSNSSSASPIQPSYIPSQQVSGGYLNNPYTTNNNNNTSNSIKLPDSWEMYDIGITAGRTSNSIKSQGSQNYYSPRTQTVDSVNHNTAAQNNGYNSQNSEEEQIPQGQTILNEPQLYLSQQNYLSTDSINNNTQPDISTKDSAEIIAELQQQLNDLKELIDAQLQVNNVAPIDRPKSVSSYPAGNSNYNSNSPDKLLPLNPDFSQSTYSLSHNPYSVSQGYQDTTQSKQFDMQNAADITGELQSVQTTGADKFEQNYRQGLEHLKAGRYRKASESFTVAAMYRPNEPLVAANQAHALFADGQYLNSALSIIHALDIYPEYINYKINLAEIIGGLEPLLHNRSELKQMVALSDAPGLKFLLCYVYYRSGNFEDAQQVISSLEPQMPKSTALIAIKLAVDASNRAQK